MALPDSCRNRFSPTKSNQAAIEGAFGLLRCQTQLPQGHGSLLGAKEDEPDPEALAGSLAGAHLLQCPETSTPVATPCTTLFGILGLLVVCWMLLGAIGSGEMPAPAVLGQLRGYGLLAGSVAILGTVGWAREAMRPRDRGGLQ